MRPEIVWARYAFAPGFCFRCDRSGVDTAAIGTLTGWGVEAEIRACRDCVVRFDELLWQLVMNPALSREEVGPVPGS